MLHYLGTEQLGGTKLFLIFGESCRLINACIYYFLSRWLVNMYQFSLHQSQRQGMVYTVKEDTCLPRIHL